MVGFSAQTATAPLLQKEVSALTSYVDVAVFGIIGAGFVAISMVLNKLLSQRDPYANKLETYESGEYTFSDARINFNIRYYVFALTFFVFDLEAIFMYPWAVTFKTLDLFGFMEMVIFLVILGVGLLYAWKKKVLKWV